MTRCHVCGFDYTTAEQHGMEPYDCLCTAAGRIELAIAPRALSESTWPSHRLMGYAGLMLALSNPALHAPYVPARAA